MLVSRWRRCRSNLQRVVLVQAMRASLEVKDYAGAASRSSELDLVGIPAAMMPAVSVLRGRLAEALGREQDALDAISSAAIGRSTAGRGRSAAC